MFREKCVICTPNQILCGEENVFIKIRHCVEKENVST